MFESLHEPGHLRVHAADRPVVPVELVCGVGVGVDTGRDQLLAFMEPQNVDGIPNDYDAGINDGLGVPGSFYHFAFEAGTEDGLEAKRQELMAKGVTVTDIVDHDWAKSIYFKDPNGISLEYCCLVREVGSEDDVTMQIRFERTGNGMRERWDRLNHTS